MEPIDWKAILSAAPSHRHRFHTNDKVAQILQWPNGMSSSPKDWESEMDRQYCEAINVKALSNAQIASGNTCTNGHETFKSGKLHISPECHRPYRTSASRLRHDRSLHLYKRQSLCSLSPIEDPSLQESVQTILHDSLNNQESQIATKQQVSNSPSNSMYCDDESAATAVTKPVTSYTSPPQLRVEELQARHSNLKSLDYPQYPHSPCNPIMHDSKASSNQCHHSTHDRGGLSPNHFLETFPTEYLLPLLSSIHESTTETSQKAYQKICQSDSVVSERYLEACIRNPHDTLYNPRSYKYLPAFLLDRIPAAGQRTDRY